MKKAVLITAEGSVTAIEIDPDTELTQLQARVAGDVEVLRLKGIDMWCNDLGKRQMLPFNRLATVLYMYEAKNLDVIMGDVVITGPADDEGESRSISLEAVKAHLNVAFAAWGIFVSLSDLEG